MYNGLMEKIENKKAKIAVVGLGYVGLPLAVEFAKAGFDVTGIEIDKSRLKSIIKKESYITDISTAELQSVIKSGKFGATGDFKVLKDIDVILICVPTPLKRKYEPDISYIKQSVKAIAKNIKKGALVVLESTTYPGTTEEVILPILEAGGARHGEDFFLCFSPERIDPANDKYPLKKIPKVIGGITEEATLLGQLVYKNVVPKVVAVSSPRVAETVKLLENTFRIVNIGMIDELAMMCHKMGIDIWEVVDAAATKPFGFMPFYPGPGIGGHCLDKNELLFVKEKNLFKAIRIADFVKYAQQTDIDKVELLSFDPDKKKSMLCKATAASVRPYSGKMFSIITEDGRRVKVTDLHPMFVHNKSWQVKYAKDLQPGDKLPVCIDLCDNKGCISKIFKKRYSFKAVAIKSISALQRNECFVYSIETENPHSFITSYGIAVHNCIPKDPLYLYWKAKHFGFKSRFIKLASDITNAMPAYIVSRVGAVLSDKNINLNKANILIVGATYKKDVKDLRKSPSLDMIDILKDKAGRVSYYDPLIPYLKYNHTDLKSISLNKAALARFDCVIIATNHSSVDYDFILKNSKMIFDTRNVYNGVKDSKVFKL